MRVCGFCGGTLPPSPSEARQEVGQKVHGNHVSYSVSGPISGSVAAGWQASVGTVRAGSAFQVATMQSGGTFRGAGIRFSGGVMLSGNATTTAGEDATENQCTCRQGYKVEGKELEKKNK